MQTDSGAPSVGDVVLVRHRQYLVEGLVPPPAPGEATLARLCCLDDDAQGRRLEVLWELELGARRLAPEESGLGEVARLDPPRAFAAYLHALKWNCVTATDARLFQAPFRAGIELHNHQLTPLKKALELPRVNLFIADDVGLGKTIEAGLVLQELILRQRAEFALVVCPASVTLQWRDEMEKRFGLRFEIYNRAFVSRRRQERGFAVNPWSSHSRFVVSYQTLRRPEHRDPLLQRLGERTRKSLLILDEAHTAAPASAQKYAVDSGVTKLVRDVAPRFENRLFLSATPHNGHSNSFSSLLEILDPQRFTRGVPIQSPRQLEPVMVRRLKGDLRALGVEGFPERRLVRVDLDHEDGAWWSTTHGLGPEPKRVRLAFGEPVELRLSELFAEYRSLVQPKRGRGRLVFENLQKRLLSSVEAFHRTLRLHAEAIAAPARGVGAASGGARDDDGDEDLDDETQEELLGAELAAASRLIELPAADASLRARALLGELLALSDRQRAGPDAKLLALLQWIRENQCPGASLEGLRPKGAEARWSERRVIVFTEYGDTKRWLSRLLRGALAETHDGEARILELHGGMSDEARAAVQRAFNARPADEPVRILVATDAAREGMNLQGHCQDLFHFDLPWNPARLEQRNGRIDRALQPAPEVRCAYFCYPARREDPVLQKLVEKVDRIQHDLGSLADVVMQRMGEALGGGIDEATAEKLASAAAAPGREVAEGELEPQRRAGAALERDIEEAGAIVNASRRVMDFDVALLRDALDVGLSLAGGKPLSPLAGLVDGKRPIEAFALPALPESWQETLDGLRPPRGPGEPFWEWRGRPPRPVIFEPPEQMAEGLVQLHLQHPLVQRLLSRFLAQGYSGHDLSRVTVVRNRRDSLVRAIAFGRLSLFGPGAVRLHDEILSVAAQWLESGGPRHLRPFADEADRKAIGDLEAILREAPDLAELPEKLQSRLRERAPGDFATLWPPLAAEASQKGEAARGKLRARGEAEAEALREILRGQRAAIERTLSSRRQLSLEFTEAQNAERRQYEDDERHLAERLAEIEREIEREPIEVARHYDVAFTRLQPVGLIYLWPTSR